MLDKLDSEISRILDVLNKYKCKGVLSEADTKGSLIEPVLRTLGWNVSILAKKTCTFQRHEIDYFNLTQEVSHDLCSSTIRRGAVGFGSRAQNC